MENLDSCASCRTIRLTVSSLGMYNHCPIINDPSSATWNFVSTPASTFFLILDPSFSRNWACSICSRYVGHTNSWATNPPPELMSKSAPISFRNRQRKLRCCRCRNRQRNLSHYIYIYIYIYFFWVFTKTESLLNLKWSMNTEWQLGMESTASLKSLPTHQIDSKNRVMADTWNCQKCYVTADP
jgi:hypothetical protein